MGFGPSYPILQYYFITTMILCKRNRHIYDPGCQSTLSVRLICDYILDETDVPIAMSQIRYANNIAGRYNLTIIYCTIELNVAFSSISFQTLVKCNIKFSTFPTVLFSHLQSFTLLKNVLFIVFIKLGI